MPHPITVPRLGWSMEEGVFAEWLKAPGELVRSGDLIFLLEGEKAATEIESLDSGYLCIPGDAPQSGATVKVGEVIGFLLSEGETAPTTVGIPPTATTPVDVPQTPESVRRTSSPSSSEINGLEVRCTSTNGNSMSSARPGMTSPMPRAAGPAARRMARELGIDLNGVVTPDPTGRVLCEDVKRAAFGQGQRTAAPGDVTGPIATPRARRRARELGVDWTRLAGTGRNGRIRERDIPVEPIANVANTLSPAAEIPPTEPGRHVPASKLRRIIAQRMSAGVHLARPQRLLVSRRNPQLRQHPHRHGSRHTRRITCSGRTRCRPPRASSDSRSHEATGHPGALRPTQPESTLGRHVHDLQSWNVWHRYLHPGPQPTASRDSRSRPHRRRTCRPERPTCHRQDDEPEFDVRPSSHRRRPCCPLVATHLRTSWVFKSVVNDVNDHSILIESTMIIVRIDLG